METDPASISPEENSEFLNMNNTKKLAFYNHTPGVGKTKSYRLSGSSSEVVGPAKSLEVEAGDIVDLEVYARYANLTNTNSSVNTLLTSLISAFSLSPSGATSLTGEDAYNSFSAMFSGGPVIGGPEDYEDEEAPKAYLNYILFDEEFIPVDFGFDQISESAGTAHEYLSLNVKVEQKGYLYIYLSNENDKLVDVFFDDLKVTHHTGVEQSDDYYAFGLTFNSYQRENSVKNKMVKFQGQEHIEDLDLGWDSFKWRNHMPDIGRFFNIDPLSEKYYYNSVYAFSENRVIDGIELEGLEVVLVKHVQKNQGIIKTAKNGNYADNAKTKTVHVFAHGTPSALYNDNGKKGETTINSGKLLNNALNESSSLWKNSESKEGFTVVLHTCRTGRTTKDANGNDIASVAQNISDSEEMKGVNIVAPTERDFFTVGGEELGPFEAENTDKNTGDYLPNTPKEKQGISTGVEGKWNTFQNGKMTKQSDNWKPGLLQGILDFFK